MVRLPAIVQIPEKGTLMNWNLL